MIKLSQIIEPGMDCAITPAQEAAEVLRLIIELRSNEEILDYMKETYGGIRSDWKNATRKRKFMSLMQRFIIKNYKKEFDAFLKKNRIEIFNEEFETSRSNSTYARFMYIVFFREHLGMIPPVKIEDDL